MVRVSGVEATGELRVRLEFTNGTVKEVDLAPYLRGPIFAPIAGDPALFSAVRLDPELGTIVWPGGADLDPDVLYGRRVPAWADGAPTEIARQDPLS